MYMRFKHNFCISIYRPLYSQIDYSNKYVFCIIFAKRELNVKCESCPVDFLLSSNRNLYFYVAMKLFKTIKP